MILGSLISGAALVGVVHGPESEEFKIRIKDWNGNKELRSYQRLWF
jgi:hypothetical protein